MYMYNTLWLCKWLNEQTLYIEFSVSTPHLEGVGLTEPTITMIYIDTRPEMVLDIRMSNARPTPDESSGLKVSGRPGACSI